MIMESQNQTMQQPNIIGNAEDKTVEMNKHDNVVLSGESEDDNKADSFVVAEDGFKDITSMATRSRRRGSKTHF